jgi:3-deoxy-D-arabino-heptulosonate 7-phosphate (DAHP) synthase
MKASYRDKINDVLIEIDDEILDIIVGCEIGALSRDEIADRLKELREKVY